MSDAGYIIGNIVSWFGAIFNGLDSVYFLGSSYTVLDVAVYIAALEMTITFIMDLIDYRKGGASDE